MKKREQEERVNNGLKELEAISLLMAALLPIPEKEDSMFMLRTMEQSLVNSV